jgi:hypothetical protein
LKRLFSVTALLFLCSAPSFAHHGKDFLIVESYELPHRGDVYFVSSEMFSRANGETTFTTEPSLLFGLGHRFAGEVHVHIQRLPGESLNYQAIAPAIHYQLTPPESEAPWKLAVAAEYELARHSDENSLAARLIAAHPLGEGQVVINIGGDHSTREGTHASYAVGFRPAMEARVSWGIEAQGRFERGDQHQLILGLYTQPNERFTFKAGAGAGLGSGKPSAVFRTGVVWHF